jgi:hypothetical protein
VISPSQGRYLHRTTQTQNKRTQTSMPLAGFEPTIPVFKRAKTFHALDRAASVTGIQRTYTMVKFHGLAQGSQGYIPRGNKQAVAKY